MSEREYQRLRPNRKSVKSVYIGVLRANKGGSWEAKISINSSVRERCCSQDRLLGLGYTNPLQKRQVSWRAACQQGGLLGGQDQHQQLGARLMLALSCLPQVALRAAAQPQERAFGLYRRAACEQAGLLRGQASASAARCVSAAALECVCYVILATGTLLQECDVGGHRRAACQQAGLLGGQDQHQQLGTSLCPCSVAQIWGMCSTQPHRRQVSACGAAACEQGGQ